MILATPWCNIDNSLPTCLGLNCGIKFEDLYAFFLRGAQLDPTETSAEVSLISPPKVSIQREIELVPGKREACKVDL